LEKTTSNWNEFWILVAHGKTRILVILSGTILGRLGGPEDSANKTPNLGHDVSRAVDLLRVILHEELVAEQSRVRLTWLILLWVLGSNVVRVRDLRQFDPEPMYYLELMFDVGQ